MQTNILFILVGSLLLIGQTAARIGIQPASIPRLTKVANYTLNSFCLKLHNPDPYLDERVSEPYAITPTVSLIKIWRTSGGV